MPIKIILIVNRPVKYIVFGSGPCFRAKTDGLQKARCQDNSEKIDLIFLSGFRKLGASREGGALL